MRRAAHASRIIVAPTAAQFTICIQAPSLHASNCAPHKLSCCCVASAKANRAPPSQRRMECPGARCTNCNAFCNATAIRCFRKHDSRIATLKPMDCFRMRGKKAKNTLIQPIHPVGSRADCESAPHRAGLRIPLTHRRVEKNAIRDHATYVLQVCLTGQ